jgi:hypothetical protein
MTTVDGLEGDDGWSHPGIEAAAARLASQSRQFSSAVGP